MRITVFLRYFLRFAEYAQGEVKRGYSFIFDLLEADSEALPLILKEIEKNKSARFDESIVNVVSCLIARYKKGRYNGPGHYKNSFGKSW